jgi:MFS family permease
LRIMAPLLRIPVNVEFAALLFSGILVAYTLRVNISVAAQQMRTELNWTEDEKGLVLSAFYWGYALGQLPASYFALFNGARVIFGLSVFIPSVLTLLFPVAAETNFTLALFVRMMIGLVEACCFPSVFHFFPHWVPEQDKTFMVPAILSGVYLGEMIAFFFSGMIIDESYVTSGGYEILGWRGAFYIFGLIGVAWFPVWMYLGYERPEDHPRMTVGELSYIQRGRPHEPVPTEEEEEEEGGREGGDRVSGADAEEDGKDWYGSRQVYGARDRGERGRVGAGERERAPSGTFGERLLRSSNDTTPAGLDVDEGSAEDRPAKG